LIVAATVVLGAGLLTVTEGGAAGEVPDAVSTVTAQDFALSAPSGLTAGPNVVAITNQGKQLHEINLVEVADGKTIQDVVAWFGSPAGPPPMRSLRAWQSRSGKKGRRGSTSRPTRRMPWSAPSPTPSATSRRT
jgi:hypothetical protein